MKLLYLTTTAITLGAFGAFGTAHAETPSVTTLSTAQFTQMQEAVQTASSAIGLHTGDFQINTRAAKTQHMYKGDGASLMFTIRRHRD